MKPLFGKNMEQATLPTHPGRLGEAAALLKRVLRGRAPSEPEGSVPVDGRGRAAAGAPRGFRDRGHDAWPLPGASGCARFLDASYAGAAGARPYKLYVPSGYRGQPAPLVVMLHGCAQSPDDFAAGTGMNAAAEDHTCLVAYPGQTAAANSSRCWNWFNAGEQHRDRGEPSLIAGITRQVMATHEIDPRRVFVAGLSAGGAAAAIMGARYPDLYAAIGVHSGLPCGAAHDLSSAFTAMRQGAAPGTQRASAVMPTIVFHGEEDNTVHPDNAASVIAQAAGGARLERRLLAGRVPGGHAYRRTLYVDASGATVIEQWSIVGGGHAWSGGSPAGSFTDPHGPNATRQMLRFFLEHPRPGVASGDRAGRGDR
ncbi:MAG: PHB depolymerase family esterase [Acetobacteraceae bacterium]|nr:PHB depolymerase family esterase [Acetobacteraceae bacterium]